MQATSASCFLCISILELKRLLEFVLCSPNNSLFSLLFFKLKVRWQNDLSNEKSVQTNLHHNGTEKFDDSEMPRGVASQGRAKLRKRASVVRGGPKWVRAVSSRLNRRIEGLLYYWTKPHFTLTPSTKRFKPLIHRACLSLHPSLLPTSWLHWGTSTQWTFRWKPQQLPRHTHPQSYRLLVIGRTYRQKVLWTWLRVGWARVGKSSILIEGRTECFPLWPPSWKQPPAWDPCIQQLFPW